MATLRTSRVPSAARPRQAAGSAASRSTSGRSARTSRRAAAPPARSRHRPAAQAARRLRELVRAARRELELDLGVEQLECRARCARRDERTRSATAGGVDRDGEPVCVESSRDDHGGRGRSTEAQRESAAAIPSRGRLEARPWKPCREPSASQGCPRSEARAASRRGSGTSRSARRGRPRAAPRSRMVAGRATDDRIEVDQVEQLAAVPRVEPDEQIRGAEHQITPPEATRR